MDVGAVPEWARCVVYPHVRLASSAGQRRVTVLGLHAGVGVYVGDLERLSLCGVDRLCVGVIDVPVEVLLRQLDDGSVKVSPERQRAGFW